jgi:uncharacterized membrane protein SpoIIM required for sporulation
MRQAQFVARHVEEWNAFEAWLDARAARPRRARAEHKWAGLPDEDVPARYRRLCQQLGLARRRGYSPAVTARLQDLMQRGHNALYRPPPPRWSRAPRFLIAEFPRLVREEWLAMLASLLLFVVPLVGMYVAIAWRPELANSLFDAQALSEFESMYADDPAAKLGRDGGTDFAMFGHYIFNNIGIGFRTFAAGLLAGIGSAVVLVYNGLFIGGIAGHLGAVGSGGRLLRFAVTHGAFELTGIVIAGGAGMRLGLDVLAPGRRRRIDALVEGGRRGAKLCVGVFFMLLVAAFIEAFWSSIGWLPDLVRFPVAGVLWTLVLVWLWRGGRGLVDAP